LTVTADQVNPANNGKLVHLTGAATSNETLTDPDFGVSVQAIRLMREVEVFQWKEAKSESKKDSKKVVTYTYKQVWSTDKPATKFEEPAGHTNPPEKPYADATLNSKEVKLGAFVLNPKQVERIPANDPLPITKEMVQTAPAVLRDRMAADPEGYLFVGTQPGQAPDAPQVGAVRVRFKVAKPQTISVVAQQTPTSFEPFAPEGGKPVDLLKPGAHTASALFESAQSTNLFTGWVIRGGCFLFIGLGLFLVIRLLKNIGVPKEDMGGIKRDLLWALLGFAFAIPMCLLVVGSRWVTHQLPIGGGLLGAGVVLGSTALFLARRKSTRPARAFDPDQPSGAEDLVREPVAMAESDYADLPLERVCEENSVGKKTVGGKERGKAFPTKQAEPANPVPVKSNPSPAVETQAIAAATTMVVCAECNKRLKIPSAVVGKKIRCPVCKGAFVAQLAC
jgi:Transmembrane protein 43